MTSRYKRARRGAPDPSDQAPLKRTLESTHSAAVDAWLARALGAGASSADVVREAHAAVEAVWKRAVTALGSVTLSAIAERVLHNASERYGFLSAINPRPNGDARWREVLHERLAAVPSRELMEAVRFGLVELLTVIGTLTAEILSPDLHRS